MRNALEFGANGTHQTKGGDTVSPPSCERETPLTGSFLGGNLHTNVHKSHHFPQQNPIMSGSNAHYPAIRGSFLSEDTAKAWQRLIRCLKLQVIFRKRATNYRGLLRKITCQDKASLGVCHHVLLLAADSR